MMAHLHNRSPSILCKSWFSLSHQISQVTKTAHVSHGNKSPGAIPWVLEIGCTPGDSDKTVWWMVDHFPAVFLKNCSNWCCSMWMSIVMENDHTIEHLWMCLSNFRSQNFVKEMYSHMLVPCSTIWYRVCDNNTGIIVSYWRMITRSSICESVCRTLGLKILRKRCTHTCWSPVLPYDTVFVTIIPV